MNTPSHVIFNLALLGRRARPKLNSPIFWGALLPDLAMFGFYGWAKLIANLDEATIWRETYYEPFWQTIFDVGNSIPLALLAIGVAVWGRRRYPGWQPLADGAIFLALSVILHCLGDLPVHVDDGHRHFWPLSNFRFESPISYWDPDHHGRVFALVEFLLALIASWRVWRLLRSRWVKALLVGSNVLMWWAYVRFYL
ncbi:hypothetical protein IQ260_09620 [Leptolyngbya cf. ectocarpi LEGE 11479]|uniref:Metal-dependent hydrolase n=1 Tax=Leptolyngbya cf. ectocarpi LEGE 11479 TaxID=1828722 RepID=A0A928ZSV8_LEPEC|nr:hypothetical protein [Leptolyngbya ectocarpi]MBE9066912.1 hypothetical protein [Leptolyngbya cf. ectocarpi LEGE 11479]